MEAVVQLEESIQQCMSFLSSQPADSGPNTKEVDNIVERLESLCLEITNFMTARQVEMTVENSEEKLQQAIDRYGR
jgi:hypothetical protein